MKNHGDICFISGGEVEAVDCIIGGSPCQNLSVAGNRKGLEGSESRLFIEQMRVIKEMRRATGFVKPRYMIWENVTGTLSCNKGKDFQCVLNGCVQAAILGKANNNEGTKDGAENIKEEGREIPDVPMPKDGKWSKSGILYDDMGRWSIAWRVHDAQYWGVAQRRRRIALVCDFGGMSAPEVLFEQQSLQRYSDACNSQREGSTEAIAGSVEESDSIWDARGNGNGRLSATITGDHDNRITDYSNIVVSLDTTTKGSCFCIGNGQAHVTANYTEEISQPLNCMHDQMTIFEPCVYPIVVDREALRQGKNAQFDFKIGETETAPTLVACGPHAVAQPIQYRVRRLTPLECTRLQGYPDGWVDIGDWTDSKGKKHKEADAPKYKALGNSIALPFWRWLCRNIVNQLKKDGCTTTMASLFDGIGGFPLCWTEATQSKETVRWISEIEEFPLAVTRHHFS